MRWFSIETHALPCDKSGRNMLSSSTASLFAMYEADFRCTKIFNRVLVRQISPVRPMSAALRAVLERVARAQPDALED